MSELSEMAALLAACEQRLVESEDANGRLRAELSLARVEVSTERALLRSVVDAFPGPFGLYTVDGDFVDANAVSLTATGRTRDGAPQPKVWDLPVVASQPSLREQVREAMARAARGESVDFESHTQGHDGRPAEMGVSFRPIVDDEGRVTHVATYGVSVEERNQALVRLRESEARLKEAQRIAMVGSWELDIERRILSWSGEALRIFELGPDASVPTFEHFLEAVHSEDRAMARACFEASLSGSPSGELVYRLFVGGKTKWVQARWENFYDSSSRPTRSVGTTQDVTFRVLSEEALRQSERAYRLLHESAIEKKKEIKRTRDLLRAVVDSSPDVIYVKDLEHRYLLVNSAAGKVLGRAPESLVGRADSEVWATEACFGDESRGAGGFHADDLLAFAGELVRRAGMPVTLPDGRTRVFDTFKTPLRDEGGRVYGVLGYSTDVTEQRDGEMRQRAALEEKETLLREIHHRVKNNLQIISSLMHFQAKKVRTEEDRAAFADGRNRLLAMMLVHEKLYQSNELSRVDFGAYVASLSEALTGALDRGGLIDVRVDAEEVRLPIEVALPAGMILCELLTNAFKYAYPGSGAGVVEVSVRREGDAVLLEVGDSGTGFPAGFEPERSGGFGWQLVRTLVLQLDGTLHTGTTSGVRVTVRFTPPARGDGEGLRA